MDRNVVNHSNFLNLTMIDRSLTAIVINRSEFFYSPSGWIEAIAAHTYTGKADRGMSDTRGRTVLRIDCISTLIGKTQKADQ